MSEYNCRVKRVVPKDHILRIYAPVFEPDSRGLSLYQEAVYKKNVILSRQYIDLKFSRWGVKLPDNSVKWSEWGLMEEYSYIGDALWPNGKPDLTDTWYAVGTALHHRKPS